MNYLEMNRMLNQLHTGRPAAVQKGFKVDIAESADGYRIDADLPGFTAGNVDVRVEESLLIIEAIAPESKTEEKLTWHARERREDNLKRSFILPKDVNKGDVEADMKNGVLSVNLKKKPEAKPFTVKINEN